ncbi:hypothetical protein CEXT_224701 [Caerostris extrusa]|uniref:Uncharacterized protein n=1 Tax=Caerostris extrusa TaxID=172846 RepID=A0AAV4ULY4_CAEEX|nr:hypothetical protein CEXT_224701 [Caerostris extrusa]
MHAGSITNVKQCDDKVVRNECQRISGLESHNRGLHVPVRKMTLAARTALGFGVRSTLLIGLGTRAMPFTGMQPT